jgi:amyloid beta precursor protein binding protein 1
MILYFIFISVIEAHPDSELPDLRLEKPFPELVNFCNSMNLNEMNKKDHSHVAYLVILYKYLEIWKSQVNMFFHV